MIKPSIFYPIMGFCCLFIMSSLAQAGKALNDTLEQFYSQTQSMQADFKQIIHNSRGKVVEQSTGSLILSRPDKFILEYKNPSEQKYISNGKTLWIYDVELEQVNIKTLDEGLGDSPALLLSSNSNIYKHYQVNDVISNTPDDYRWVQLQAREDDVSFERVLLAFKGSLLMRMKMYDSFAQVTDLIFSEIQVNKRFSNKLFDFTPPEDVDVIGGVSAQ